VVGYPSDSWASCFTGRWATRQFIAIPISASDFVQIKSRPTIKSLVFIVTCSYAEMKRNKRLFVLQPKGWIVTIHTMQHNEYDGHKMS